MLLRCRTVQRFLLALLAVSVFFTCLAHGDALALERIRDFSCTAQVRPNGTVRIIERIAVLAEGRDIRRGIIRDLPLGWSDGRNSYRLDVAVQNVRRNGRPEPVDLSREGDTLSLRIGDPGRRLQNGEHVYEIQYLVSNVLTTDGTSDEFYWNVTGNDWIFPMERVRFSLELPGAADHLNNDGRDGRLLEINAYSGSFGQQDGNFRILPDGRVENLGPLQPGEGLTVSFTWPTGLTGGIARPHSLAEFLRLSLLPDPDNWKLALIPLVSLFLLYWFWRRHGQDPRMPVIIPRFEAPGNTTPGVVRALRNLAWDESCLVADILNLAAKGYLEIVPGDGNASYALRRIDTESRGFAPTPLPDLIPDERDLLDKLLTKTDAALNLDSGNHATLAAAQMLSRIRCQVPIQKLFTSNAGWLLLGLLPLLLLPASIYLAAGPEAAVPCCVVYLISLFPGLAVAHKARGESGRAGARLIPQILVLLVSWAVAVLVAAALFENLPAPPAGWLGLGWLGVLICIVFTRLMPRHSEAGVQILAEIEGLVQYMDVAEQHRLEALYPPADTIERFERLLPYALALDVAETWADRFDEYLKKVAMPPPRSIAFVAGSPGWSRSFTRSMRSFGRIYAASAINPATRQRQTRSSFGGSGRGGGGFSGGGRGGGGGRGW